MRRADFLGSCSTASTAPLDWEAVKSRIVAGLDLIAEYRALGLRFVQEQPDSKGRMACHAFDRTDANASAVVFLPSGVYHDSGGGKDRGFLDCALAYGSLGRFSDVIKHYAARAGVVIGKVDLHSGGRFREATSLYREADGRPRYAVFRYREANGKKTFTQHGSDGKGGWRFGTGAMDGVEPLPYRLPELLAADPEEPIWIVEGEKAADRLAGLDLLATTSHGGSGNTDRTWPVFRDRFAGRECYVLPDHDPEGYEHARKVCDHLAGVARLVKLIVLPDLAPKGDICDWLDRGHDLEELGQLTQAAPVWIVGSDSPDASPLIDDGLPPDEEVISIRMSDVVRKEVTWLFPDRIPIGKVTLIAGDPGLGKSFLMMDLIARVTTGGQIPASLGECVPKSPVVLLCAEDDLGDTVGPRLDAAGADGGQIHVLTTLKLPGGRLEPFDLSYIPHLERMIVRAGNPKLLVIDPVTSYIGGKIDDHKNSALRTVLGPLADMAARRDVAVVIVTHLNKSAGTKAINRITGSLAYAALARAVWLVVKDPEEPGRRLFLSVKNNLAPDPSGLAYRIDRQTKRIIWEDQPILMTANDALKAHDDKENGKDEERQPRGSRSEQARVFLINLLGNGRELPHEEIVVQAKLKGIAKNAVWEAKELAGVVVRKAGFQGKWYWSIPSIPNPEEVNVTY